MAKLVYSNAYLRSIYRDLMTMNDIQLAAAENLSLIQSTQTSAEYVYEFSNQLLINMLTTRLLSSD